MVEITTSNELKIINLFRLNYASQFHVREMGKLLDKSHVTLLPHLKELTNLKVLIPKLIGKNKIFSLNFDNFLTRSYLLQTEVFKTIKYLESNFLIKKVTSEIFNLNLDGVLILFGSYAKRSFKDDSDIDLFYIGKITEKEIQTIKKIGKTYGKIINVKKSTNFQSGIKKKDPLIVEIIKNHIILQNPEPFVNALWRYYNEIR